MSPVLSLEIWKKRYWPEENILYSDCYFALKNDLIVMSQMKYKPD